MEQKPPKNKKEAKKGLFANLTKRQKISVGTLGIVSIAGIFGGLITYIVLPKGGTCIIGINEFNLDDIDPLVAYFQEAYILWQVCEGLFDIDSSGGEPELVNVLATGHEWNDNATELTVTLRQGVRFHDGTLFNAMAVKWNFDRIYRLIESFPGLIPWLDILILPDGRPILNETLAINDYTVKFVLNEPFVPFLHLLTQDFSNLHVFFFFHLLFFSAQISNTLLKIS